MPKAQVPDEVNDKDGSTSVESAAAKSVTDDCDDNNNTGKDSSLSKPDDDHNDVGTESESKSGSGSGDNSKEVSANTAAAMSNPVNTDKGDIVFPNTARIESVAGSNAASAASEEASNWAGENIEKLAAGASAMSRTVGVAALPSAVDTASVSTLSSVNAPKVHLDPLSHSKNPPGDSPSTEGKKPAAIQELPGEGGSKNATGVQQSTSSVPSSGPGVATATSSLTGSTPTASTPGAFRVYPGGRETSASDSVNAELTSDRGSSTLLPGTFSYVGEGMQSQQEAQMQVHNPPSVPVPDAESQTLHDSNQVATEAYLVEEQEVPQAATVVRTYFGIERKRLVILSSFGALLLGIVLAVVLGILLPKTRKDDGTSEQEVCGPLCGPDSAVPDPKREVFGYSCKDWDFNSTFLPAPHGSNGTCVDVYQSAAYGCGCPGVEIPPAGCGTLCQDGSQLADPDLLVKDINNQELACKDWQLKAQFDKDSTECVNYNAVGVLCGCPNNEPHPDACGPLCGDDNEFRHSPLHHVWETSCGDWNLMSSYLPSWYNNPNDESCDDYYYEVRHGCSCEGQKDPLPEDCGSLCKERRICSPICDNGESAPDPALLVRRETCEGWELQSRLEVHSIVCPFYNMAGAQCGCENAPPADACGPLCGPTGVLPDPDRVVQGETCKAWDYMSTFLPASYGKNDDGGTGIFGSCTDYFSGVAYGCGCPDFEPPSNGCGTLCGKGVPLPEPTTIVNARTCADVELQSLHETDPKQCSRYEIFGSLCGCPSDDEYNEECFNLEHLMNETYYFSSGGSLYTVSFGSEGFFAQIQSNSDLFMIGHYHSIDEDHVASYGGGAPCGLYGPRSGTVTIVEAEDVSEPTINYVIEPSICVYHAELLVPKFCTSNTTVHSSNTTDQMP